MRVPEILVLTLALVSCAPEAKVALDDAPRVEPDPWRASISARIHDASLAFYPDRDGFIAGRGMTARFDPDGAHITVGQDMIGLTAELVGAGSSTPDPVAPTLGACRDALVGPDGGCIRRLEYSTAGLTEWWVTQDAGFEQGWTIDQRPGTSPLRIDVAVEGADAIIGESEVWLQGDEGGLLMVRELQAWDADGVELSARFARVAGGFQIRVEDQGARYPVTIDPVYTTASWTGTGAIADEGFGQAVAGSGDVNGDGYDDVIVGAGSPYDSSPGHAYVYLGSATGLSDVASTTLTGSAAADLFGSAVAGAGDVNGDGYDDVIVGAGVEATGSVTVYMGSAAGLSPTATVMLTGESPADYFGKSVSGAGDVDGDGYDDVIVGAWGHDSEAGRAYVYLGGPGGLESVASTTLDGEAASYFGTSVSSAGDVDADGYDDVIVGADGYDGHAGMARVYLGSAAGVSSTPTATFTTGATYGHLGRSVSGAGDVNGDGYDDVVVGVPFYGFGRTLVYEGYAGGVYTTASTTLDGENWHDLYGWSVSRAGDVDGDGYDDVIVGARDHAASTGRAYVYLGSSGGLSSTASTVLTGEDDYNRFSDPVAAAGDVNGDAYDDVIIGASSAASGAGRAYVYLGESGGLASTAATTLDAAPRDDFGTSVSAGDVNGDGYDDVIVGAYAAGEVYVYLGSAVGLSTAVWSTVTGTSSSDYLGYSVSGAGDVNADGYDDVVIGAPGYDSLTGAAHIWLGGPAGLTESTTLLGDAVSDRFGSAVAGAGDVNGDGYDDVIVGAYHHDSATGRVYLYLGGAAGIGASASTTLDGEGSTDEFGWAVSGAGDVNGDGYDDVIVGARTYGASAGRAYVFPGGPTGLSRTAETTLNGSPTDYFGYSVSGAGDVDRDGYDDVIVGATYASSFGQAYVYRGSTLGVSGTPSTTLTGPDGNFGAPVSGVGDLDGDGYDDVTVSYQESSDTGHVLVYRGSPGGTSASESANLEVASHGYMPFGFAVSGGDVNGDGLADLVVGSPDTGSAYAFYGFADRDGDGVGVHADCDDSDATVGAPSTWYRDADLDGYGAGSGRVECTAPAGYVASAADCDDTDAAYHPGALEAACTDPDYNCDGAAMTDDLDADGYSACTDCDDADASVNPGATEVCNLRDDNCDGVTDDASRTWYLDADGDGYGDPSQATTGTCDMPEGYAVGNGDCDDTDASIRGPVAWYPDGDGDGYGVAGTPITACAQPAGTGTGASDCDDADPLVHPGADETCNGIDEDCDGDIDEDPIDGTAWYRDRDGDSYGDADDSVSRCSSSTGRIADGTDCDDNDATVHPGAEETPDDGVDQDCDGADATSDTGEPPDTADTSTDVAPPDKSPGCACASVEDPGSGALGLGLLGLGIVLRRRRPPGRGFRRRSGTAI